MADLYYYETGYIDESYFVYTADAESAISAITSVSCDATVIAGGAIVEGSSSWMSDSSITAAGNVTASGESAMSSQFTQTAMISHIEGADLFAMSSAALAAEVSRIRDNNIAVSSVFSISTDASRTRNYSSEDAADFTIAIANQRVRFNEAALDAAFSLVADNVRVRFVNADLSSTSLVSCDAERIPGGVVVEATGDLSSASSITIDNIRLRLFDITLSTAVTQTSQLDGILEAQSNLTSTFNLSATISHIEGADLSAFTDASLTTQANVIVDTIVNVSSDASTTTQANRLRDIVADLSTAVTQQTDANRSRDVDSSILVSASVSADVNEIVILSAALTVTAEVTAIISHIEGADLNAFSNCSISANVNVIRQLAGLLTSNSSISANLSSITDVSSALTVSFSQSIIANRIKNINANLVSTTSLQPLYLSYKNRHNHSAYIVNEPSSSARLRTDSYKYGSGSFWLRGAEVSQLTTLQIQTLQSQAIDANEDFYISIWMDMGSTSAAANTYKEYVNAGNWSLGYKTTVNQNYPSVTYNGTSHIVANAFITGGWSRWEFFRSGSNLTLQFTNGAGTVTSNTVTYAGAIATGTLDYVWFTGPGEIGTTGTYFDEFYMAKGISAPANYKPTGEIFDGALSTTEFLLHFNENFYDDLSGPIEAQAALTSSTAQTVQAKRTAELVAGLTVTNSLSAQPDNFIRTASASLSANGFVATIVGKIMPQVADLTSSFSLNINAGNLVVGSAGLIASTSLTAQGQDLDLAEITLTATTALTFEINVVKSAQANISANAVQTLVPVKTARITKTLTATSSLTASALDLDFATANLTSSFALRATANRWYPRPNGYWDASIGYQPQWNNWSKLRVQDIAIAPSSLTTGFSETLVNLGGYLTITRTYAVGPTRNYLYINGVEYDISGEIIGGSPTLYDLQAINGGTGTFGSRSFSLDSFDATTSKSIGGSIPANAKFEWDHSFKVLYSTSNPVWKRICTIGTYSLIYRSVAGTNFGVTDDVTIMLVTTFNTSLGTYSGVITSNSFSLAVIDGDVGFGPTFTFAMSRGASSVTFTIQSNYLGENSSESIPSFMNLAFSSISAGTYYSYDNPNSGYLIVKSAASDILFTDNDFNESSIVSQYPYVLNDQTGVLGLYDAYGSLDRTGLVNQAQVALTSTATQTVNANKLISMAASLTSNFTQSSTVRKIARTPTALQVTATATSTGNRIRFGQTALTATATLSVTAKKYNGFVVTQTSTATVNAQPYDFTKAQANLTSSVSVTPTVLRIKQISAEFTAFYTELTAAYKNATGTILLESTSALTCTGVITADQPQYMFSQVQMTATGVNTQFGAASISSASTFNLVPTYLRRNESVMTVSANLTVNNSRTRNTSSTLLAQAFAFPATDNSKITGYSAAWTSTSQMVTNNQILRLAQANLLSTTAMPLVFVGILVRFEANLQVNGFVLSAGEILNIDEYYQLKIPSETRTLWIEPESRILSIDSETRVNKIKGYPTP